ncbi:MAG: carbohydrate binding domain-containing protein [Bifidobacterium sp.]|nr:carbohydrate binding domain-containing protein [Bifidobacterium sp.]
MYWHFKDTGESTWATLKMTQACDGYVSATIDNPDGKELEFVFNNGNNSWDNVNGTSGRNYVAGGETVVISDNSGNYGTTAPCAVEEPDPEPDPEPTTTATTTVYYPSAKFGADSTNLYWHFKGTGESTWATLKMTEACDGYVSATIDNPDGQDLEFVFNNGNNSWDNVNGVSGRNYVAGGETVVISDNSGNYGTTAPCAVEEPDPDPEPTPTPDPEPTAAATTTVYYPSSKYGANSTYFHWRFKGAPESTWTTAPGDKMTEACDGYVSITIDNPEEKELEFVFNNGNNAWDNVNGISGRNYVAGGETVVISDNSGDYGTTAPCAVEDPDPEPEPTPTPDPEPTTIPVSSVTISPATKTVSVGATTTLSATVAPSDATNPLIAWSSSDTDVATVDGTGKVTARAAGTATITASADGKSVQATITVTDNVVPAGDFQIVGPDTVMRSDRFMVSVTGLSEPVNADDIEWTTSNWRVIGTNLQNLNLPESKVRDADGIGTATITATVNGKSASKTITVVGYSAFTATSDLTLTGVGLEGSGSSYTLTVAKGGTTKVAATVVPTDATYQTVLWKSSDPSIVRIDADGTVRGIGQGTATLTATTYWNRTPKEITVTVS